MKSNRSFWLIFLLIPFSLCFGQGSRVLDLASPGTLSMHLSYNDMEEITDLTLTGKINAKDFSIIELYMKNLKSLNLKDVTITKYSGTTSPQIPAAVYPENEIPSKALLNKKYLTKVILPDNLISIRESAFAGCSSLSSIVFPSSLKIIADKAFEGCFSLKSIDIPKSVIAIEEQAFNLCSALSEVKLNEGLQTIGKQAFANCSSLETVTLPHSLIKIGESAFAYCKKLKHIYSHNPNPINIAPESLSPYKGICKQVTLYVPASSVEKYSESYTWGKFKQIMPIN